MYKYKAQERLVVVPSRTCSLFVNKVGLRYMCAACLLERVEVVEGGES